MAGTPPSSVPSSSGGGLTTLVDTTLGADTATFDVTGIAAGGKALWFWFTGRSSKAAVPDDGFNLRFNNDSGANYQFEDLFTANSVSANASGSGSFAQTIGSSLVIPAATAPANTQGIVTLLIPNYDGTTFHKPYTMQSGAPDVSSGTGQYTEASMGVWLSTAAITRVTFFTPASLFKAGSRLIGYVL